MRCGLRDSSIPRGGACNSPGIFRNGCVYEIAWESLALADTGTDATLIHVPRSGRQRVLGFIVDQIQPLQAATGPGAGPLEGQGGFMSALTVNGTSYMPRQSATSGAAFTSNVFPLAAFGRKVQQLAGGLLAELANGDGTPWAQFGIHMITLGISDNVTITIANQTGLAADFGGVIQVYQIDGGDGSETQPSGNPSTSAMP